MYTYTYMYMYIYMCGNTAYRAIEPLKITAREIPSPRQPYPQYDIYGDIKKKETWRIGKKYKYFLKFSVSPAIILGGRPALPTALPAPLEAQVHFI